LQGDGFITVMKDNTVPGRTMVGTAYNLYFLPVGAATYADMPAATSAAAGKFIEVAMSALPGTEIQPCRQVATASRVMAAR
jgi:hypothetical protein